MRFPILGPKEAKNSAGKIASAYSDLWINRIFFYGKDGHFVQSGVA